MNKADVPMLLSALGQFQYVEADPVAVEMWAAALDYDMTLPFAVEFIAKWYGELRTDKQTLKPGAFNAEWRDRRRVLPTGPVDGDRHCKRGGCRCSHTDPCYRGWLEGLDVASPCRVCRFDLFEALSRVPSRANRTLVDMAAVRDRRYGTDNHKEEIT